MCGVCGVCNVHQIVYINKIVEILLRLSLRLSLYLQTQTSYFSFFTCYGHLKRFSEV